MILLYSVKGMRIQPRGMDSVLSRNQIVVLWSILLHGFVIDCLQLDRTPRHGDPARTWRYKLNQWMDACMVAGLAGFYIYIINVLKKDRHAREKFNVCCEPYPLFPVNFIVMPLFCCKARMFGGSSSVLFLSTLIILSVYEYTLIFNVMRIIYLLLDWSCGCMIYDLPACHHVSNHHKTWSFLSKPCPPLATLPKYNPCPPACSYNIHSP